MFPVHRSMGSRTSLAPPFQMLLRPFTHLVNLWDISCGFSNSSKPTVKYSKEGFCTNLTYLCMFGKKLRELNLASRENFTDNDLSRIVKNCPHLTKLVLPTDHACTENGLSLLQNLPLKHLKISRGEAAQDEYLKNLPQSLETLDLSGDPKFDVRCLPNLAGLSSLETLNMANTGTNQNVYEYLGSSFDRKTAFASIASLPKLKYLNVENGKWFSKEGDLNVLSNSRSLTDLNLKGHLINTLPIFPTVVNLNLSNTMVTNECCAEIAESFSSLKQLDLTACPEITMDGLEHFNSEACQITVRYTPRYEIKGDKLDKNRFVAVPMSTAKSAEDAEDFDQ